MIIIELFFGVIALFVLLVLGLGLSLWFNVRHHISPFLRAQDLPHREPAGKNGDVIEGEYKVIDEGKEE